MARVYGCPVSKVWPDQFHDGRHESEASLHNYLEMSFAALSIYALPC